MTTSTIDWKAAARVAGELGKQTRELVWEKEADQAREFALRMAAAHNTGIHNATRVSSYLELAVLLGYSPPPAEKTPDGDERVAWLKTELSSMQAKIETLRDAVARIVAEQDQAEAAAAEEEHEDEEVSDAA
jgi:hypothetical protein